MVAAIMRCCWPAHLKLEPLLLEERSVLCRLDAAHRVLVLDKRRILGQNLGQLQAAVQRLDAVRLVAQHLGSAGHGRLPCRCALCRLGMVLLDPRCFLLHCSLPRCCLFARLAGLPCRRCVKLRTGMCTCHDQNRAPCSPQRHCSSWQA